MLIVAHSRFLLNPRSSCLTRKISRFEHPRLVRTSLLSPNGLSDWQAKYLTLPASIMYDLLFYTSWLARPHNQLHNDERPHDGSTFLMRFPNQSLGERVNVQAILQNE
jgi:hypothetical protein